MHSLKNANPTFENTRGSRKAWLQTIFIWSQAIRPKTLTAAIVPVVAGTALASTLAPVSAWIFTFALIGALAIQIATNLINDYVDFDKGADTHERIGPRRVTQSQLVSRSAVRRAAGIMLAIAIFAGIPLVIHGGPVILLIGLVSLVLAYSYTGGPFPLAYLGLGDLFVILFFGVVAVGGVFYLETGLYSPAALVLGVQIGLLSTVLIAINNLRDVYQDAKAEKRTVAVRWGVRFARYEILGLMVAPFLLQIYWVREMAGLLTLAPFLLLPLAYKIVSNVFRTEPSEAYNRYLAQSAALHAGYGLILSLILMKV